MDRIDKSDMRQVLLDYPRQFKRGLEISEGIGLEGNFRRVIVNGVGGSALPGELLGLCLQKELPVIVNRSYNLPMLLADDMLFASSYSGTTEETLAAYCEAMKEGASLVGFSSGGTLEEWCKRDGIPHVKYPKDSPNFQPRCATGYAFSAMLNVLANSGAIPEKGAWQAEITAIGEYLKGLKLEDRARQLASQMNGLVPIVYASDRMSVLARMWKIKFNENSKVSSFWNVFPELNHNEMVGYTSSAKPYCFIILRDREDHPSIRKRMGITAGLIEKHGGRAIVLDTEGTSPMARAFGTAYLGDWVSYYLALGRGVDPTPVDIVEEFKKGLKEAK